MEVELLHSDGRTNRHNEAISRFSQLQTRVTSRLDEHL